MLDYRIRSFLAVIENGTLQKASEALGLTQPAVSQHLRSLEQEYGVPLFDHVGRRLVLNDAGILLRNAAGQAGQIFSRLERELKPLLDGRRAYRMAATLTIGEFILPSYLGEYRLTRPALDLSIRIENTESVLRMLDRGEIDLALVEGPFPREKYPHALFLRDEMVFIGGSGYLPAEIREVDQGLLAGSRLILRERGSGTRHFWEEYLNEHQIRLPREAVIMEVGSLSAIKSLVESGFGCSVMSSRAVEKELLLGTVQTHPLRWGPLIRDLYFVWSDGSPRGFVEDFIRFARTRNGLDQKGLE